MADQPSERPIHLRDVNDDQAGLYYRMLDDVSAGHGTYWDCLRGLDAPAADKYAVAEVLGATTEAEKYAVEAGIDPHKGKVDMTTLNRGDQFIGPDEHTRYIVTTPASEHEHGWIDVRNLSMPDDEAVRRAEQPDVYGPDSRGGFFAYDMPVYVERVETAAASQHAAVADDVDEA
jgi:hypothetical protein